MIVLPMLMIVLYAFTSKGNEVAHIQFTLENFTNFLQDDVFLSVLTRSLWIAFYTTMLCLFIGYPIAYIISQGNQKSNLFWIFVITMPTWINMLVRTYALMGLFQTNGLINKFLGLFGLGPFTMIHTSFAVVMGMVYNFIPFMILQIYSALSKMDKSYIEAAHDLGANRFHTFYRIILPLSLPGVISGITLVFLPAVSSFFIPQLLGGGQYVLIGNVIETEFLTTGNWNSGSAISLIMALIIIFSLYLTKKVDKGNLEERRT